MASYWEQKPGVFKATEGKASFFSGLFNIKALTELAGQCEEDESLGGPLRFSIDLNAARYVDGKREDFRAETDVSMAVKTVS